MSGPWIRLSLIAGVAAVFSVANIDQLFESFARFVLPRSTASMIGFLAIASFAWRIVSKRELVARYRSPNWTAAALGGLSVVLIAGPHLSSIFGWEIARLLRFMNFPVVHTLAAVGLLLMLFKISTELRPQVESQRRATDVTWVVIIGLTAFIGTTFSFIPSTWMPPIDWSALLQGRFNSVASWWGTIVQWLIAFGAAYLFATTQQLDKRIDFDRPGLRMLRVAVHLLVTLFIVAQLVLTALEGSKYALFAGMLTLLVLAPMGLLAKFLLTFGGLKLLFSLQSAEPMSIEEAGDAAEVPPPALQKTLAPARDYFAREPTDIGAEPTALQQPNAARPLPTESPETAASPEAELRAALAINAIDPRRHDRLHRILASDASRTAEMLDHAKDYMAVLLSQSLREQAIALYRACAVHDPNFKPHGDQVLPLVRLLLMEKEPKSALRVMNRFDAHHPQHRDTALIFYLSARLLKELQQPQRAVQLLKVVINRFPEDRVVPDARSLLASLEGS